MKKILNALLALLLTILLITGGYAAYLFVDYSRIPDNQQLVCVERMPSPLSAGEELSILTWNLGFGAYNDTFSFFMDGGKYSRAYSREICENNIQTAIASMQAQSADIILLQEVDVKGTRSHDVDQIKMIETAFSGSHSSVYAQNYDSGYLFFPLHSPIGSNQGGILTLAKAQITGALRRSLPVEGGIRKFFDLDRCYSVSRIPVSNGKELALFNLHLSAYTADGLIATEQIRLLLADMQKEFDAGNYVIAGGDFNKDLWGNSSAFTGISAEAYPWAQAFPAELLSDDFTLVNSCNAADPVLSCRNADMPYEQGKTFEITLDGFIASDNIQIFSCDVLDEGFRVSDHNPVVLRFMFDA